MIDDPFRHFKDGTLRPEDSPLAEHCLEKQMRNKTTDPRVGGYQVGVEKKGLQYNLPVRVLSARSELVNATPLARSAQGHRKADVDAKDRQ